MNVSLEWASGGCSRNMGYIDVIGHSVSVLSEQSLVGTVGSDSDLFPFRVGLHQGCPLPPVLFIIFMDRISGRSQVTDVVWFRWPQDYASAFCR